MKGPGWSLINKVSLVRGSSNWHRFELVDQFIRRFSDWWLLGTTENASWGIDTWDTANQYVSVGERGGLLSFVLFLAIITLSFRKLGVARRAAEVITTVDCRLWVLRASLFAT